MQTKLTEDQLREFAVRGYVVVPQAVPRDLVDAANQTIDKLIEREPPAADVRGNHFYFPEAAAEPTLGAVLTASPAWDLAQSLAGPLVEPWQVQVSLNIPPYDHRPGRPHIDGDSPDRDPATPPGTFTLLAGILLSDQPAENSGNLWVWPGTHLTHAAYFREHGPESFSAYPDIDLPEPEQILGRAGDLLLAHFLLGHNIGGNYASGRVRRATYHRIKREGHDNRWRDFLQDPWLDYDPVRALVAES